jgi:secondary thiamine-phosphate synthase enzyme
VNSPITVATEGPGLTDITARVAERLPQADGAVVVFVRHTSCSLLIQENADPDVQADLMGWIDRLVPRADTPDMRWLRHRAEGPDDMPAHIKAAHLPVSLTIPVTGGKMALGTWQGIYLWEHRDRPHRREVAISFLPA